MTTKFMQLEAAMLQIKIDLINYINNDIDSYIADESFYAYDDELYITEKILTVFNETDITLQHYAIINFDNYIKNKINEIYWSTVEQYNKIYGF